MISFPRFFNVHRRDAFINVHRRDAISHLLVTFALLCSGKYTALVVRFKVFKQIGNFISWSSFYDDIIINHTLIYTTLNTMVQAHWTSNWKNWINEKGFYYTDENRKACWCSVRSNPSQIYIDLCNLMNSICGNTLDMIFMKLNIRDTATLVSSGGFWTEQLLSDLMQCWSIQSHKKN